MRRNPSIVIVRPAARPDEKASRQIGPWPWACLAAALLLTAPVDGRAQTPSSTAAQPDSTTSAARQGAGAFSFVSSIVELPAGERQGSGALIVKPIGKVATAGVAPLVWESGPAGPTVTLGKPTPFGDPAAGEWRVPVTVEGFPANTSQTRTLQVSLGGAASSASYTIKNTTAAFSWTLLPLGSAFAWSPDAPLSATIVMGPVAATNLTAHAVLVDDASGKAFAGGDLQVCENRSGPDCKIVRSLDPGRPYRLYLRPANGRTPDPGKYAGTIDIVAAQDKASATITLYVSGFWPKFWGLASIVTGVLASLASTIFVRNRLARDQVLMPAAMLASTFDRLAEQLAGLKPPRGKATTITRARIEDWRRRLQPKALQAAELAPSIWSPAPPSAQMAQSLQSYLDAGAGWVTALQQIVGGGLAKVSSAFLPAPGPARTAAAKKVAQAWTDIDGLSVKIVGEAETPAPAAPTAGALAAQIAQFVATLPEDPARAELQADMGARIPGSTLERLTFQVAYLSLFSWALFAFLAIVVGADVLVLNRLDFGRPHDFIVCLVWGFGLPAAGGQLGQLNPSAIGSAVGVTVPRSS